MGLILTTLELCERAGVRRGTLLMWICRGRLHPVAKRGGQYFWPSAMVAEVRRLAQKGVNRAS
jgi:predicted site-specific integrase-resolvase